MLITSQFQTSGTSCSLFSTLASVWSSSGNPEGPEIYTSSRPYKSRVSCNTFSGRPGLENSIWGFQWFQMISGDD